MPRPAIVGLVGRSRCPRTPLSSGKAKRVIRAYGGLLHTLMARGDDGAIRLEEERRFDRQFARRRRQDSRAPKLE